MLMRVKEETAGRNWRDSCLAARESCYLASDSALVDLDWATYAGKRRHLPWFLLSALLLVENGVKVFMHGTPGSSANRLYTENMLSLSRLRKPRLLWNEAKVQLKEQHFSYLSLESYLPKAP